MNSKRKFIQNEQGLWNVINKDGLPLFSDFCIKRTESFYGDLIRITNTAQYNNLIDENGYLLFPNEWFAFIQKIRYGLAVVVNAKFKQNFLTLEGKLLSPIWFDNVTSFNGKYAVVNIRSQWNFIDKSGHLISDIWFDKINFFLPQTRGYLNGNEYFLDDKNRLHKNIMFCINGK